MHKYVLNLIKKILHIKIWKSQLYTKKKKYYNLWTHF